MEGKTYANVPQEEETPWRATSSHVTDRQSMCSATSSYRRSRSKIEALGSCLHDLHDLDINLEPILETDSIYGCAIAMPQIARSAEWHSTLTFLCFRSIFNLCINLFIQMSLLMFVAEASRIMDPLGGQMHLCDFGKNLENCPDGDHCLGPGGTRFTKTRVYPFSMWSTRVYVRQALLDIVPSMKDEIHDKVDPGEYGMENDACRFMCSFLFTMSVAGELLQTVGLVRFLYDLPSENEEWIEYDMEGWEHSQALQHVTFKVAGMSRMWKLITVLLVVAPKLYICHQVLLQGIRLLMDTSAIMDQILGAMSMTFIIGIDEMIYTLFASAATKHMMDAISTHWSSKRLEDFLVGDQKKKRWQWALLIPKRFVVVCCLMLAYVIHYYFTNCRYWHGAWVSTDMYFPKIPSFTWLNFLTNEIKVEEGEPFWSMSQFDTE